MPSVSSADAVKAANLQQNSRAVGNAELLDLFGHVPPAHIAPATL
jgi:hypothetical protein